MEARPAEKPFTDEELLELEERVRIASEKSIIPRLVWNLKEARKHIEYLLDQGLYCKKTIQEAIDFLGWK